MANEIELSLSLKYTNGALSLPQFNLLRQLFSQTTIGYATGVWYLGTSEENLTIGELVAARQILLLNLDATNYCDVGMSDAGTMKALGRLMPYATYKDFMFVPLKPSTTVRGQANTAGVKVFYIAFET